MARPKKFIPSEISKRYVREDTVIIDGFEVTQGDIIKVKGQYGGKFRFTSFTTNTFTGSQWIDCFEIQRGQTGCFRSFKIEDVKRVPKKRKRAKRVV
jgi:hypothetical protein